MEKDVRHHLGVFSLLEKDVRHHPGGFSLLEKDDRQHPDCFSLLEKEVGHHPKVFSLLEKDDWRSLRDLGDLTIHVSRLTPLVLRLTPHDFHRMLFWKYNPEMGRTSG